MTCHVPRSTLAAATRTRTWPGESFVLTHSDDRVAIGLTAAVGVGLVVLVSWLRARDRRAAFLHATVEWDLAVQRRIVATMQRALLPATVPATSGVRVGWHYRTGGVDLPVGGDWFAVVPLDAARLGVSIGDVTGHGIETLTSMAEYRYALRTVAADGRAPAEVLDRLDAVMRVYSHGVFATCVYGVIDALGATWTSSNAGHPPPLLVRDGVAELLEGPHGMVAGVGLPHPPYEDAAVGMKAGDLIVLYTDGLVERRRERATRGRSRRIRGRGRRRDRARAVRRRDVGARLSAAAIRSRGTR